MAMKSQYFSVKHAGLLVALFCAFGFTLASGTTAQAQYRNDDGQHRRDHDRDWRRDRRDQRRADTRGNVYDRNRDGIDDRYERNRGYGNNGVYGNNGRYGNGSYGNGSYGYNIAQIAQNQGYRDGLNTGASDGQRGQSYNPQRSHFYQNATYGYSSSYGNRETYKQYYRDGFQRGYQEGFRQYGSNNGRYGRNYPNSRAGSILGNIFGRP
jgi:hypothetical protein